MKRLGLDVGEVRIGVAASDGEGRLAFARLALRRRDARRDVGEVGRLAREEEAGELVLGLPLRADGGESDRCAAIRRFGRAIELALGLPLRYQDERHSSEEAREALLAAGLDARAARQRIDAEAARIILQRFLDGLAEGDR